MQLLQNNRFRIALLFLVILVMYLVFSRIFGGAMIQPFKSAPLPPPPPVKRFEAASSIPARVMITKSMLREINLQPAQVPTGGPPREWITDPKDVAGHISQQEIPAGVRLERGMVGELGSVGGLGPLIPPGRRAMTIRIERDAPQVLQSLIKPGDHVDVVVNFKESKYVKTVIEDVPVLAVDVFADGRDSGKDDDGVDLGNIAQHGTMTPSKQPEPAKTADGKPDPNAPPPPPKPVVLKTTITLGVTPKQAEILALADAYGFIEFIVRGRDESSQLRSELTGSRRGTRLTDLSPYLATPKEKPASANQRIRTDKFVKLSLPPALPRTHPTRNVPAPAPPLDRRRDNAPAGEQPKNDTHSIEVYSPGRMRTVEVPRDPD